MKLINMIVFLSLLLVACNFTEQRNAESSAVGVIVHGCNTSGWIKNTNTFPVRVKKVRIDQSHGGEKTEWVGVIDPERIFSEFILDCYGFHIYSMDGAEIGWIRPVENGKPQTTPADESMVGRTYLPSPAR